MGKGRRILILVGMGALLGGAAAYVRIANPPPDEANYRISWSAPQGWTPVSRSPLAVFRYKHPTKATYLRAALSQSNVEEHTPTADAAAQYQIDTTAMNQKNWTAKRVGDIKTPTLRYAVIRREQPKQAIVSAFGVKGNTTVIVSLTTSGDKASKLADEGMAELEALLNSLRFQTTVLR